MKLYGHRPAHHTWCFKTWLPYAYALFIAAILLFAFYFTANPATSLKFPPDISQSEKTEYLKRRDAALHMKEPGKNNANIYNEIGSIRNAMKDYEGAVEAFRMAQNANPQDPGYARNLGIVYGYLNNYEAAEQAFMRAYALAPKNPEYWLEIGDLYNYNKIDNREKARKFYEDALQKTDNNPDVLRIYANYLENVEKNYPEAIKYVQKLMEKDERNRVAYLKRIEELKEKIKKSK